MSVPDTQIILASSSPRRKQLLDQINVSYLCYHPQTEEIMAPGESPHDYALRNSLEKALNIKNRPDISSRLPILAADTIISINGNVLGKPKNRQDFLNMLELLSDSSHHVITAVTILVDNASHSAISNSTVTFRQVTREERDAYWETGEPLDKAGGYAIQGQGAIFIKKIEGSYSGIMGLPLFETSELIRRAGITTM